MAVNTRLITAGISWDSARAPQHVEHCLAWVAPPQGPGSWIGAYVMCCACSGGGGSSDAAASRRWTLSSGALRGGGPHPRVPRLQPAQTPHHRYNHPCLQPRSPVLAGIPRRPATRLRCSLQCHDHACMLLPLSCNMQGAHHVRLCAMIEMPYPRLLVLAVLQHNALPHLRGKGCSRYGPFMQWCPHDARFTIVTLPVGRQVLWCAVIAHELSGRAASAAYADAIRRASSQMDAQQTGAPGPSSANVGSRRRAEGGARRGESPNSRARSSRVRWLDLYRA